MTSLEKAVFAAKVLDDKKAFQIEVIDVRKISDITDYFVIANGSVNTHVHSLADELELKLREREIHPLHIEGYASGNWVLLDYTDVIIHIFTPETRDFYDLGRLWNDGERIKVDYEEKKEEA